MTILLVALWVMFAGGTVAVEIERDQMEDERRFELMLETLKSTYNMPEPGQP